MQRARTDGLAELQRQWAVVKQQKDRLLNLRLLDEIEQDTFAAKHTELRDREAELSLLIEGHGRQQSEHADLAVRVFELSQALTEKWVTADIPERRQLLEIICFNLKLVAVSLVPTMRKPFDVIAEGLVSADDRGDWTPIELFIHAVTDWEPPVQQMFMVA